MAKRHLKWNWFYNSNAKAFVAPSPEFSRAVINTTEENRGMLSSFAYALIRWSCQHTFMAALSYPPFFALQRITSTDANANAFFVRSRPLVPPWPRLRRRRCASALVAVASVKVRFSYAPPTCSTNCLSHLSHHFLACRKISVVFKSVSLTSRAWTIGLLATTIVSWTPSTPSSLRLRRSPMNSWPRRPPSFAAASREGLRLLTFKLVHYSFMLLRHCWFRLWTVFMIES